MAYFKLMLLSIGSGLADFILWVWSWLRWIALASVVWYVGWEAGNYGRLLNNSYLSSWSTLYFTPILLTIAVFGLILGFIAYRRTSSDRTVYEAMDRIMHDANTRRFLSIATREEIAELRNTLLTMETMRREVQSYVKQITTELRWEERLRVLENAATGMTPEDRARFDRLVMVVGELQEQLDNRAWQLRQAPTPPHGDVGSE